VLLLSAVDAIRRIKITFPYDPANDDELKLEVGDIVDVINDVSSLTFASSV